MTQKTLDLGQDRTGEILKLIASPRLSVTVSKTVQQRQYEPKQVSVTITQTAESADPSRIKAMIDLAESEVLKNLGVSE